MKHFRLTIVMVVLVSVLPDAAAANRAHPRTTVGTTGLREQADVDEILGRLVQQLRDLATSQEGYFADHAAYTESLDSLDWGPFELSTGVSVELRAAGTGFSAVATHRSAPGYACAVHVGEMSPPLVDSAEPWTPVCLGPDGQTVAPGPPPAPEAPPTLEELAGDDPSRLELAEFGIAFTPRNFMVAAEGGKRAVVELFLKGGIEGEVIDAALFGAASNGHAEAVRLLVEHGADVNRVVDGQMGWQSTPLVDAATEGNRAVVDLLIEAGADLNTMVRGTHGAGMLRFTKSALRGAAHRGHTAIVERLVEAGAAVDGRGEMGETALMQAAMGGILYTGSLEPPYRVNYTTTSITGEFSGERVHSEVARTLLDGGADVNAQDSLGITALMWAAVSGRVELAKLLLDRGADVRAAQKDGTTAFRWVVATGLKRYCTCYADMIRLLLAHNVDDELTLHEAAGLNVTEVVAALMQTNVDVNAADADGDTALMSASRAGLEETVRILLEGGARAELKNGEGESAAVLAAIGGHQDLVGLLTDHGAQLSHEDYRHIINNKQRGGQMNMYFNVRGFINVVAEGRADDIELFLLAGIDVNGVDENYYGTSALPVAVRSGRLHIVERLIEVGADINARNRSGQSLVAAAAEYAGSGESARQQRYGEIIQLLVGHRLRADSATTMPDTLLLDVLLKRNMDLAGWLVEQGADVDFRSRSGYTLLLAASAGGDAKIVTWLLNRGADIEAVGDDGQTALQLAQARRHVRVVELLEAVAAKRRPAREHMDRLTRGGTE